MFDGIKISCKACTEILVYVVFIELLPLVCYCNLIVVLSHKQIKKCILMSLNN